MLQRKGERERERESERERETEANELTDLKNGDPLPP